MEIKFNNTIKLCLPANYFQKLKQKKNKLSEKGTIKLFNVLGNGLNLNMEVITIFYLVHE